MRLTHYFDSCQFDRPIILLIRSLLLPIILFISIYLGNGEFDFSIFEKK